jgi:hypothetical protein
VFQVCVVACCGPVNIDSNCFQNSTGKQDDQNVSYLYIIVLFLGILFRYNTLFTYTSKSILLVIDLIFSVFLGPDEHLQVSECLFAARQITFDSK